MQALSAALPFTVAHSAARLRHTPDGDMRQQSRLTAAPLRPDRHHHWLVESDEQHRSLLAMTQPGEQDEVTVVYSRKQLHQAVSRMAKHIEIRRHLDLRLGHIKPVAGEKAPAALGHIATTLSTIRVRNGSLREPQSLYLVRTLRLQARLRDVRREVSAWGGALCAQSHSHHGCVGGLAAVWEVRVLCGRCHAWIRGGG